jgi:hypothetical protein
MRVILLKLSGLVQVGLSVLLLICWAILIAASMAMAGPASVGVRSTELRGCFGQPKRAELVQQEIRSTVELMALPLMGMDRRPSVSVSVTRPVCSIRKTRIHRNRG